MASRLKSWGGGELFDDWWQEFVDEGCDPEMAFELASICLMQTEDYKDASWCGSKPSLVGENKT
jgi:hypothetical protein|tara:strand:+ start:218 stop:409 length:192 start_codon:yes stop_codon:yes gene_type:complete